MQDELKRVYNYSKKAVKLKTTPKFVKLQLMVFNQICSGKHPTAVIDDDKLRECIDILDMMIMPDGINIGKKLTECLIGYQWVIIIASLCTVYRDDHERNFFKRIILEIPRKNWKSFTSAVIMVLAMIMYPNFSKLFSVAADGSLSRMVKTYMDELILASPSLSKWFTVIDNEIRFASKKYQPLNYSNSRLDGRQPSVFIVDEAGTLPNAYAITAMTSGQILVKNPLGFIISTKYPKLNNPFEDEVLYAKKVLKGVVKDDSVFALMYEPDEELLKDDSWMFDDLVIKQANPAALEIPAIFENIKKLRQEAIEIPSKRSNFLCKHLNVLSTDDAESFIDIQDLRKCRTDHIDWKGREVYIGVDLSQTDDITSVGMVSVEGDRILATAFPFIPADNIEKKTKKEHLEYQKYIDDGLCYACGDRVISYEVVENFVFQIEKLFEVKIIKIGYDPWNCTSSANRWAKKYETVMVKQHSSVLHAPTKLMREKILSQKFVYQDNELIEIHFTNAKCAKDTNLNLYLSKKRSIEKIDIVMSILDALCLANTDIFENQAIDADNLIQVV